MDGTNLLVKRASSLNVGIGIEFIGPEKIDAIFKLGARVLDRRGSGASRLGGGHGNLIKYEVEPQNQIK